MQEGDELCLEAVDLMLTVLGAEAGHMGIRLLASGGVYLTGAPNCQLLAWLQDALYMTDCHCSHVILEVREIC